MAKAGEDRHERIAVAAYYFAELRGFAPGAELDDWLKAEAMIDAAKPKRSRAAAPKPSLPAAPKKRARGTKPAGSAQPA